MKKHLKKAAALLLAGCMAVSAAVAVSAADIVPLRASFEERNADVYWDAERGQIVVRFNGQEASTDITFTPGSDIAHLGGEQITLASPVFIDEFGLSQISAEDFAALAPAQQQELLGVTTATATALAYTMIEALDIAGITIAVVHRDSGFTWTQGFGYRDVEAAIPVDEHTLFDIGSITKTFTAAAIMQLVEQGIIDLDEPIVTYIPEFSTLAHPVHGGYYRNITTRMLLTHTSGIEGDFFSGMYTYEAPYEGIMNDFLPRIADSFMNNTQLYRVSYANNGTLLLGVLIARMGGHMQFENDHFGGYWQFLTQYILQPAGMNTSTFAPDALANRALPYLMASMPAQRHTYVGPISAGGLQSSAYEMARFMHILLDGGGDILSEASVSEMFRVQDDMGLTVNHGMNFGLGTFRSQWPSGLATYGHNGGTNHFFSGMQLDFDSGIGVFVSTNTTSGAAVGAGGAIMYPIINAAVYEITGALPTPLAYWPISEPAERPIEELEALTGFYFGAGWLELDEDGYLSFPDFPGLPFPLVLSPTADGGFTTELGVRFWFEEVEGRMGLFLDQREIMDTERLEGGLWQADESFKRWVGVYNFYQDIPNCALLALFESDRMFVDERGYAFAETVFIGGGAMSAPVGRIDDYTFYILGTGRNMGLVMRFYEDADGRVWGQAAGTRSYRIEQ